MSSYSRVGAVSYASLYWNKVCHDGYIGVQSPTNQRVAQPIIEAQAGKPIDTEGLIPPELKGADCAHFVSCCIGKPGGGLSLGAWNSPPAYGIFGTTELVRFLLGSGRAQILTDRDGEEMITEPERAWNIVRNKLQPADIITYLDVNGYKHLALHIGTGMIASHTHYKYGENFDSFNPTSWTCIGWKFIHIL